jgi:hypothetical protein
MEFAVYRFLQRLFAMTTSNEQVQLRVHGLGPMDAYHVTEEELVLIEKDENDLGLDFQFAQFGITVALSFLASFLITPIPFGKAYVVYIVVICVGFVFGITNGIRWYRNKGRFSGTIIKIRERRVGPTGNQDKEVSASALHSSASPPTENPEHGK